MKIKMKIVNLTGETLVAGQQYHTQYDRERYGEYIEGGRYEARMARAGTPPQDCLVITPAPVRL